MRPTIPMSPDALPQQRITEVIPLPAKPAGFKPVCESETPIDSGCRPPTMPRSARYLCLLEWAWGPTNNRISAYYLSTNKVRSHWLLWHAAFSDDWGWSDNLAAHGPRAGVPWEVAASHLLLTALAQEACNGLDLFDWIAEEGELTCGEILAVARAIWPPEQVDALEED